VLDSFIPPHGGYKNLLTYRKSQIIYDATVYFTRRFFRKGDRTVDQMVQAARSGKQNIIEGSMASGTSKETRKTKYYRGKHGLRNLKGDRGQAY